MPRDLCGQHGARAPSELCHEHIKSVTYRSRAASDAAAARHASPPQSHARFGCSVPRQSRVAVGHSALWLLYYTALSAACAAKNDPSCTYPRPRCKICETFLLLLLCVLAAHGVYFPSPRIEKDGAGGRCSSHRSPHRPRLTAHYDMANHGISDVVQLAAMSMPCPSVPSVRP